MNKVYVLNLMEDLDKNGNFTPVLYGVYSTREKAESKAKEFNRFYDVTECVLDE